MWGRFHRPFFVLKSSRNAYARYEQGRTVPTIQKFTELLKAVNPDVALVVRAG